MTDESKIDEGLYSRQLYVVGKEAMLRMQKYSVLISGLGGLGVEVAKNVILAGMKKVAVHDDSPTTMHDLSSQFYLTPADVGKPRAGAAHPRLQELNQYVAVDLVTGDLTPDVLAPFDLLVVTDCTDKDRLVALNETCRAAGKHFIAAATHGLYGYCFTDLGDDFTVVDSNGEKPKDGVVVSISPEGVVEADEHGLQDGDFVTFVNIEGMTELNDGKARKVSVVSRNAFKLAEGVDGLTPYTRGGYFTEAKMPSTVHFKSLKTQLEGEVGEADMVPNFLNFDRPKELLALTKSLWDFAASHEGRLPAPHNMEEAGVVAAAAVKAVGAEAGAGAGAGAGAAGDDASAATDTTTTTSPDPITRLAAVSSGNLNPMAAFFGGVVGQEVMKSSSGRFTPIPGFLFHDAVEALPTTFPLPADEVALTGTRYDGQIAVFGKSFQAQLADMKLFLVGAGALGCEFLKNYACMGVATGSSGHVLVTDMDSIEKSNLNRQFLFRSGDVGQMKSDTAVKAARVMNPELKVDAVCDKIAPDTEDKYNQAFWSGLSVVNSALDNVQARMYIDSKCVEAKRPLLESGTLGTKCHSQTIIPHQTPSYASTTDPQDDSFPVCTLKFFPNLIEHTLQWSRDEFELLFHNTPEEANLYLTRADHLTAVKAQRSNALERLATIGDALVTNKPTTFNDCLVFARNRFEASFRNNILQLLEQYPLDHMVTDGQPFWSAKKRPPTPVEFSVDDPMHMQYVVAAANLYARMYGIPENDDVDAMKAFLPTVSPPPFVPSKKKIAANDEEAKKLAEEEAKAAELGDLDDAIDAAAAKLPPVSGLAGVTLTVEEFEKDDDANRHMDFIAAAGNLRARQYRIPEADTMKAKQIVGRIVPAIATTTALATGMVMLELYKLVHGHDREAFRDSNVNLGINQYAAFEPPAAESKTYRDTEWTLWDSIDVEATCFQDLADHFGEMEMEMLMVSTTGGDTVVLFDANDFDAIDEGLMDKSIVEVYAEVLGKPVPPAAAYLQLDVMAEDNEDPDADLELPPVRVALKGTGK